MKTTLASVTCGLFAVGCLGNGGGDGDADVDSDVDADTDTDADSDADCPAPGTSTPIALGVTGVTGAAGGDFDGDGRMDLVVVAADGMRSFVSSSCGSPDSGAVRPGTSFTGVAVADLDGAGGLEIVAFDPDRVLHAIDGVELDDRWTDTMTDLGSAGRVLPAHLDTDPDHDVAAFDASNGNLLRVENTGSGWSVRTQVSLPPGISNVAAGPLGANERDEILFLGGGFVEVVSVADFDFSDVRFLAGTPTSSAAFADFDGDGDGDVMVGTGSGVERWDGDGATNLALGDTAGVGDVMDVATIDRGAGPEVVALVSGGTLQVVDGAMTPGDAASSGASAFRVLGGDVDGDGRDDVVAIGTDGTAWIWRTP